MPGGVLLEVSRPCPIDRIKHHKYNKESFDGQPVAVFTSATWIQALPEALLKLNVGDPTKS